MSGHTLAVYHAAREAMRGEQHAAVRRHLTFWMASSSSFCRHCPRCNRRSEFDNGLCRACSTEVAGPMPGDAEIIMAVSQPTVQAAQVVAERTARPPLAERMRARREAAPPRPDHEHREAYI